jgi:hypothetical protein
MKQASLKKWSILGLVLMGASAVTAAILPSSKNSSFENCNGVITDTDDNTVTCKAAESGFNCISTAADLQPFSIGTNDTNGLTTVDNCVGS